MPLQDISVNRNRGWSLDTTSSADDQVIYSGSGRRLPSREPYNPPDGTKQVDEGFARFLKKHASPTHQRVTAGGRIVPMEKNRAPPKFNLPVNDLIQGSANTGVNRAVITPMLPTSLFSADGSRSRDEVRNGVSKPLNPNANSRLNEDRQVLTEPFPKFYDGQHTRDNTGSVLSGRTMDASNAEERRNILGSGVRTLNTGSNIAPAMSQSSEKSLPVKHNADSATFAAQPLLRQDPPMLATAPMDPAYMRPQAPVYRQASLQQGSNLQLYMPNKMSSASESTSNAFAKLSIDNGQDFKSPILPSSFAAYPAQDNYGELVPFSSFLPMLGTGQQATQSVGLPFLGNQLGLYPTGYYTSDPFNAAASSLPPFSFPAVTPGLSPLTASLTLNNFLANAEAQFQDLTARERTLDQYLAMHREKLDGKTRAHYADVRMQLVEQRSDAKAAINRLQNDLNSLAAMVSAAASQPYQPPYQPTEMVEQHRSSNKLNVEAPTWVPRTNADNNKAVTIRKPTEYPNKAPERASTKAELTAPAEVHIATVPAVPVETKSSKASTSPQESPVDEWGARIGAAPPELERQQSDMLESMVSEQTKSGMSTSPPTAWNCCPSVSPPDGSTGKVSSGDSSEREGSWDSVHPGPAPPEREAEWEQYFDAMRKESGVKTTVTLATGKKIEVEGQNLKQPAFVEMDEFQKDYWQRKPDTMTKVSRMLRIPERSFENLKHAPLELKSKQTEEWINDVGGHKPTFTGRPPWMVDGTNLINTPSHPLAALQNVHVTSKTMGGLDGATEHLKGRARTAFY